MIDLRRPVVWVVSLGLLVLGACGGDDEPGAPSTPVASETPTASETPEVRFEPSPVPPRPSEGWPEEQSSSEVTAEEVARAWFDAYNDALLTGDTERMRAMSFEECVTCESRADQIERFYGAGGGMRFDGVPYTVSDFEVFDAAAEWVTFRFVLKSSAGESANSADAAIVEFGAEEDEWAVTIRDRDGRLFVEQIGGVL